MFHMNFKICLRHLGLLEIISFEKVFKTVAQKFACKLFRYKVFVHLLHELLVDSFFMCLEVGLGPRDFTCMVSGPVVQIRLSVWKNDR